MLSTALSSKYPPPEVGALRLLAPQRGLIAIEKSKSKPETAANCIIPELSNFVSPPAEPGVYPEEISNSLAINGVSLTGDQFMIIVQKRKFPFLNVPTSIFRPFTENNEGLLLRAVFFVIIFLATLTIRGSESVVSLLEGASNLDLSWQLVLEYAAKHNFQFGKDIVFTFGPLGYLYIDVSQGHLFLHWILFAIVWSLYVAWAAVGIAWNLSGVIRYLFLAWVVFFVPLYGGKDQFAFLVILYFGHLLLRQFNKKVAVTAFFVFIPVLSLIKFTFFIASIAVILVSAASYAASKQYRRSVLILAIYSMLLCLLWVAIGQSLANFPSWVKGSL